MKNISNKYFTTISEFGTEMDYTSCVFENIKFNSEFRFGQISLSKFVNCSFDGVQFGKNQFKECEFEKVKFNTCRFNFFDFFNSKMYYCDLIGCRFFHCSFENSFLQNISFNNSLLNSRKFQNSTIVDVDFSNKDFKNVDFSKSTLISVNFQHAKFDNCDFNSARLKNCNWENVNFFSLRSFVDIYSFINEEKLNFISFNKLDTLRLRLYQISKKLSLLIDEKRGREEVIRYLGSIKQNRAGIEIKKFNSNELITEDWEPDPNVSAYFNLAKSLGVKILKTINLCDNEEVFKSIVEINSEIVGFEEKLQKSQQSLTERNLDLVDNYGIDEEEQIMRSLRNGTADNFGF